MLKLWVGVCWQKSEKGKLCIYWERVCINHRYCQGWG